MVKKKVILDVDSGVDDALAIILALKSPELKVEGITCVSGNVPVDKVVKNVLKTLEVLGAERIPVCRGLVKPLVRTLVTAEDVHGKDGLGDSSLPDPRLKPDSQHAIDFIIEKVMEAEMGEITLVATGPLTNIAVALMKKSIIAERIGELVIMGGAYGLTQYGCGNVTPAAEFNIYVDPEAAMIVFGSGVPITAVGLDITADPSALLTKERLELISSPQEPEAKFVSAITNRIFRRFGRMALHDPMAVAVAVDRSLVTTKMYHVDIERQGELTRGQTVADKREWLEGRYKGRPNVNVCTSVDGARFLDLFMRRVAQRPSAVSWG